MKIRGDRQIFNLPVQPNTVSIPESGTDGQDGFSIVGPQGPQGPAGTSSGGGGQQGLMPVNDEGHEPLIVLTDNLAYRDKANLFNRNQSVVGSVSATSGYFERSRSTAIGEWTAVAYNSANFTTDAGTWTVDSGDQQTYSYILIGKTMFLQLILNGTTIVGSPGELRVAIPGGFTCNAQGIVAARIFNGGAEQPGKGFLNVLAAATYVRFILLAGGGGLATFTAGSNNTTVQAMIIFEVQ